MAPSSVQSWRSPDAEISLYYREGYPVADAIDIIADVIVRAAERDALRKNRSVRIDVSQIFEMVKGERITSLYVKSKGIIDRRHYHDGDSYRSLVYSSLGKVFTQLLRHAEKKGVLLKIEDF